MGAVNVRGIPLSPQTGPVGVSCALGFNVVTEARVKSSVAAKFTNPVVEAVP